ncbi:MAG: lysophospholipid acyltransferase family protein [Chloroflexia bacterium]
MSLPKIFPEEKIVNDSNPKLEANNPRLEAKEERAEAHLQMGNAARARWYIRAFKLVVRAIFRIFFKIRVRGLKNVPSTPVIICANHLGWADTFLVLLFFPVEPRAYVLGEQQVKYISGFRTKVIDSLEIMVMLDRSKPVQAIRIMQDVLKRGGSLLIFPEGKLGYQEGHLQELQEGAAHISQVSKVPLLPVGLTGTQELWLRRTLTMRIGKPIDHTTFQGDTHTRVRDMTTRLHNDMQALLPGDPERPRFKPLNKWLTKLF